MKRLRVVDLFAGAGGASEGALAAGARVLWAANHWPEAVAAHAANHPSTTHVCQDLHQADWSHVPRHDLLWASPACQGHSRAAKEKGKAVGHDSARSTAWAVVSCAEYHRPAYVVVENVVEFERWVLYPVWRAAMERLGYSLTTHVFNAADFGVPQARVRLFIVATRHGALQLTSPGLPHVACKGIIDWGRGFEPITHDRFVESTARRIREGRETWGRRFWVPCYGGVRGGRSVDKPLGTLTTRAQLLFVDGNTARFPTVTEVKRAMSFREDYALPASRKLALHMLGNAVPPKVAEEIVRQIQEVA